MGGERGELRGYNSPSCKVCKELELNTTELPYVKTYLFQTFPIQQASWVPFPPPPYPSSNPLTLFDTPKELTLIDKPLFEKIPIGPLILML